MITTPEEKPDLCTTCGKGKDENTFCSNAFHIMPDVFTRQDVKNMMEAARKAGYYQGAEDAKEAFKKELKEREEQWDFEDHLLNIQKDFLVEASGEWEVKAGCEKEFSLMEDILNKYADFKLGLLSSPPKTVNK
jgi:hypothetical protein